MCKLVHLLHRLDELLGWGYVAVDVQELGPALHAVQVAKAALEHEVQPRLRALTTPGDGW